MGTAIICPNLNFGNVNLGRVTLSKIVPVQSIRIVAPETFIGVSLQIGLSFLPLNTSQRTVVWSITSGSAYATINDTTGVLTILSGASGNDVIVKATSMVDPSIIAQATIAVTYSDSEKVVTFFDWLKTDGNSYFSIGKLNRYDKITIVGKTLGSLTPIGSIFGVAKNASGDNWIYSIIYGGQGQVRLGVDSSEHTHDLSANTEFTHSINFATGEIVYGSVTQTLSVAESAFVNNETPFECYVFAANKGGGIASLMGTNQYALKQLTIERNGAIIHDFRPASDDYNKGAFDNVTGKFAQNIGTGEFTVE